MVASPTWPARATPELWETLQRLHPLMHFWVALVRKMCSGLVMQHSWAARLNTDVMSTVEKCFVPSSGHNWLIFFCCGIFWNDGNVQKGVRVPHESRPQDGANSEFFSCIHLWLLFLGFCCYHDKFLTLPLGFLHSNSKGKSWFFPPILSVFLEPIPINPKFSNKAYI